jgi:lipopolysaccharide transport system permease protein
LTVEIGNRFDDYMTTNSTQTTAANVRAHPKPTTIVIKATKGWSSLQLGAVWQYRELLYFMVWRDVKVRYKQTALGVLWVVLQPVISMLVFSGLFGVLLNVPSNGVPYPVFVYAGLLPWNYFAGSLARSGTSLVDSRNLITKVYFPRLTVPLSGVLAGLVDFAVGFVVLIILMLLYGIVPTSAVVFLPLFLLFAMLTALGFGLWLSALNVRYRDIGYIIPFMIQIWLYLTPVIYSASLIPERFQFLLALNPMTSVVAGFRWALLGQAPAASYSSLWIYGLSILTMLVVLVSGLAFFSRTERTFADII